ncbi:MAG: SDR family NAD(P)-dependent oxidoreductase, partial [Bdellovibrionota bacterium]
ICAFYASLALRYSDLYITAISRVAFWQSCLILTSIQVCCFWFIGFYKGIWRFASTPDLFRLVKGISLAVALSFFGIFLFNRMESIPRSIFVIDWLLLLTFLGGMRFTYRIWRDNFWYKSNDSFDKVIIVGAGAGGSQLFRELREGRDLKMRVVAFVDDDPSKYRKILHGVAIMGSIAELPTIIQKTGAQKIFIAIPSASGDQILKIIESCKNTELEFKTLPSMREIINGKTELSQLRNIEIEDLLGRQEVVLNDDSVQAMVTNKIVLITGAGGSIGSEICQQLVKYKPKKLILFEMTEFFLYELESNLRNKFPELDIVPIIGDVRNPDKVSSVFAKHNPHVVLHAAAYKHVPIMEDNP